MNKEGVVHVYSGILVIKRKESESVELRWTNLELAIQSKVKSEREKYT